MKNFKTVLSEVNRSLDEKSTLSFIKKAHAGQKYGNSAYWTHPKAVADAGKKIFGSKFNSNAYIVALLHDVIEDTEYGETELLKLGYSKKCVDSVKLLSKDKALSYEDNIKKIITSGDKIAMMVKFADNYINYTGDKSDWPEDKRAKSQSKYKKSMEALKDKLGLKFDIPDIK